MEANITLGQLEDLLIYNGEIESAINKFKIKKASKYLLKIQTLVNEIAINDLGLLGELDRVDVISFSIHGVEDEDIDVSFKTYNQYRSFKKELSKITSGINT